MHREMFKQEVQQAAKMRWAVSITLRDLAREAGMTAYNLFVKANQRAFGFMDNQLQVDYGRLMLSFGDVPPVEEASAEWNADNVLTVNFRRGRGAATDYVYLYAYVPDLGEGFLSAPVYRNEKRISVSLPDPYAGHEAQLYLMVQHQSGTWSNSLYLGSLPLSELNENEHVAYDILLSEPESATQNVGESTPDTKSPSQTKTSRANKPAQSSEYP